MTIAQINTAIFRALSTHGTARATDRSRKQTTVAVLAEVTGIDADAIRSACETLCRPTEFCGTPLVRIGEDTYAQRISVHFDHHEVVERDDGRYAVHYDRDSINSIHDSLDAACERAEELEDARYVSQVRLVPATDATFHDCGRNRSGEAVCYPDR